MASKKNAVGPAAGEGSAAAPPAPVYPNAANPPPPAYNEPPPPQQGYPPQQRGYRQQQYGYSQQQYGYPQTQLQQAMMVHSAPVIINAPPLFGDSPVRMACPVCKEQISTATSHSVGPLAWLFCIGLFFFGFWLCSFIPFCVGACNDVIHRCPKCHSEVGRCKRI